MTELDNVLKLIRAEGEPPNTGEFQGPYPGEAGFEDTKADTQDAIDEEGDFVGGGEGESPGGGDLGGGGGMGGPGGESPEGNSPNQAPPPGKDYKNMEVVHNDDLKIQNLFEDDDIDFTRLTV